MYWDGASTSLKAEVVPTIAAENQRAWMYRSCVPAPCWPKFARYLHRPCTIPALGRLRSQNRTGPVNACNPQVESSCSSCIHPFDCRAPRHCGRDQHPPDPDNITVHRQSSSHGGVKMGVKNAESRPKLHSPPHPNKTPFSCIMYRHAIRKRVDTIQLNRGPTTAIHAQIQMLILINTQVEKQAGYHKSPTGTWPGAESSRYDPPTTYVSDHPRTSNPSTYCGQTNVARFASQFNIDSRNAALQSA